MNEIIKELRAEAAPLLKRLGAGTAAQQWLWLDISAVLDLHADRCAKAWATPEDFSQFAEQLRQGITLCKQELDGEA